MAKTFVPDNLLITSDLVNSCTYLALVTQCRTLLLDIFLYLNLCSMGVYTAVVGSVCA